MLLATVDWNTEAVGEGLKDGTLGKLGSKKDGVMLGGCDLDVKAPR